MEMYLKYKYSIWKQKNKLITHSMKLKDILQRNKKYKRTLISRITTPELERELWFSHENHNLAYNLNCSLGWKCRATILKRQTSKTIETCIFETILLVVMNYGTNRKYIYNRQVFSVICL